MNSSFNTSLAISLAIHIALFAFIASISPDLTQQGQQAGQGKKSDSKGNSGGKEELLGKPVETVVVDQDTPGLKEALTKQDMAIEEEKVKKAKPLADIIKCEMYYWGIGVVFNHQDGHITEVAKGYSAYKAGLQAGDLIVNSTAEIRDLGPGAMTLTVVRGNQILRINIEREKICYESIP